MQEEGATIWTTILGRLLAVLGGIILVILILSWLGCSGLGTPGGRPASISHLSGLNGPFSLLRASFPKGEVCGE
ncbi:MAG: hypothetical protein L0196_06775 [candidate division Zixibacteria bacterium]|nr:hypothetical protein [candidate division Zixibacteria bacterium]